MKVMIVVTHLLGSGHLSRALTLGRAFGKAGHDAHVISGGFPIPQLNATGVTLHQLPPLRSDGTDFTRLLDEKGEVATDGYREKRQKTLLGLLDDVTPDILLTELFPFGRRNLKAEFLALLTAAKARPTPPRIVASIRDILAPPSKPSKASFADDVVARFYDAVLVHSDPDLIPLETSWPVTPMLSEKLRYTGFVAAPLPKQQGTDGAGEILVSAGGGSVGKAVFDAALTAATSDTHTWRILVGGHDTDAQISALRAKAGANVIVEPARADFRILLQNAAASVSLCGYNTAMDVLQSGIPAVMVPFDDGGEVEQGLRADALRRRASLEILESEQMTPERLRAAVVRVIKSGPCASTEFRFDGADETVRLCEGLLT